jgi:hypothetical protein
MRELGLGGTLSPSELRNVQQASRAGFAARGLDYTNASVADEATQTDAANRARLLQRMGLASGVVGANQAQQSINNAFTTNLLGQANNSLAASNQQTRAQFDPFNNYGMDLANTNYNAAQAKLIAASNQEAAMKMAQMNAAAGKDAATTSAIGNIFGSWLGRCWVAREVFGIENPMWMEFRHWLDFEAPHWLWVAYSKHGEKFAKFLHRYPFLKPTIRRWMTARIIASKRTAELQHITSHGL